MCFPRSPKTLTSKSEAPFAISECLSKFDSQLTEISSLMQDLTLSISSSTAETRWLNTLTKASSAAFFPSSVDRSFPTFPL